VINFLLKTTEYQQIKGKPNILVAVIKEPDQCFRPKQEIVLSMAAWWRGKENPLWTNMSAENITTELMATPRGAGID
jgi:hypothetical protein